MLDAITKEIRNRKGYINETVKTIYFGGGTPSLLTGEQVSHLIEVIRKDYNVSSEVEITLEANPEDLSLEKAEKLIGAGINRLSIGIQTFSDERLNWMNRAHNSIEAVDAFRNARKAGFNNISLDLIYAIPDHKRKGWKTDLEKVISLDPEHISLYGLTIEEKTVFGKWEKENKLIEVPENEAAEQYLSGIELLKSNGYIQYEVSNFGKEGRYSKHNNAYWSGAPYLGIGPGAHSFDGLYTRRFNVRNNSKYLSSINQGVSFSEDETLSKTQRSNEKILTQLRTQKGLDLIELANENETSMLERHHTFIEEVERQGLIEVKDNHLRLKPYGFLVADEIALRLFYPENLID